MRGLIFFLALCVLLNWLYQRYGYALKQGAAPPTMRSHVVNVSATPPSTGGTVLPGVDVATPPPIAGKPTAAAVISLRPAFEQACRDNRLELVEYGELRDGSVEFTVRGRDRDSVSAVIDTLKRQGAIEEVFWGAKHPITRQSYWVKLENGTQNHYAYWKARAVR